MTSGRLGINLRFRVTRNSLGHGRFGSKVSIQQLGKRTSRNGLVDTNATVYICPLQSEIIALLTLIGSFKRDHRHGQRSFRG